MREHIREHNLNEADFPILAQQPKLFPDLLWVWEGFHKLSAARQRGFSSLQPLLLSEIREYMNEHQFYGEERAEFFHYAQFMDMIFVKEMDAQAPKSGK